MKQHQRRFVSHSALATTAPTRPDHRTQAALTICAASFVTSAQDTTIKWLSTSYPFHEMQTIRCGTALACVTLFALREGGLRSLGVAQLPLVLLRGGLLGVASMLFYLAAAAMPYPEAVALYFTMPLLVTALAGLWGERVPMLRWLTVLAGFAGVVVILRPGTALFEPAALLALTAALLYAFGNVLTRPLADKIAAAPLAFWQNVLYLAVALALSAAFGTGTHHVTGHVSLDYLTRGWIVPSTSDLALIVALGVSTGLLMVLYTAAYRLAASSFVAPFEYTAMVWAVLFSLLFWRQLPGATAFIGILLIIGSGLFLLLKPDRKAA